MKTIKLPLTIIFVLIALLLNAQSSSNYTLDTDRQGIWHNMSRSTLIIGSDQDDGSYSPVFVDLGFRFLFMGEFWDQFKISTNGIIWFGNSTDFFPQSANNIGVIPNSRRISGLANLNGMKTHTEGNVRIKTFGTAPNRYAVIRWQNMSANTSSTSKDMRYMVVLHESEYNSDYSGEFEFIYNKVSWGAATGEQTTCGFQVDDDADKRFQINIMDDSFSTTTDLRSTPSSGTFSNLNSTSSSLKKQYLLKTNSVGTNNSAILSSCISAHSLMLQWDDNLNTNLGYAIYMSEDGVNYSFMQNEGSDASSSVITGLKADTEYWFRVHAFNEGKFDQTGNIINTRTLTQGHITAVATGNWSDAAIWSGGKVPSANDDVVIGCIGNYKVTADIPAQCRNIVIEQGSTLALNSSKEIFVNGDIENNGKFDYSAPYTKAILRGNVSNNGIWDAGDNSQTIMNGNADQTISNTQVATTETAIERSGSSPIYDKSWSHFPIEVPSASTYTSLKTVEIDIDHTYNSDMRIVLRNPAGEEVLLAHRAGGGGDNYQSVIFSNDALAGLPSNGSTITGTFRPVESLSNFTSIDAGFWTLRVYDYEDYDTGEIKRVKLTFGSSSDTPILPVHNLEINNNGGTVFGTADISVDGHLKLSNGVLDMFTNTASSASLHLSENATSDPAHDNTYVFGKLVKKGNTDFTFPVGDDGYAAEALIRFTGGSPSDEFSVCYFHQSPSLPNQYDPEAPYSGSGLENTIKEISSTEYWLIEQEKNTGTPIYVILSYKHGRSGTILDPADLLVSHFTDDGMGGKQWKNEGVSNLSPKEITSLAPITSFSPFTIGTGSGNNSLPVDWLSFDVAGEGNTATIRWSAIEYPDGDYYQLERSTNRVDYEVIDIIGINGEGEQHYAYDYTIPYEFNGTEMYYRIKQVDIDGQVSYSKIGSYTATVSSSEINLFPLPATKNVTVTLAEYAEAVNGFSIMSANGQSFIIDYEPKGNCAEINIEMLPAGLYILQISIGNEVVTKQFIKQ